jgi:hypothetical protein
MQQMQATLIAPVVPLTVGAEVMICGCVSTAIKARGGEDDGKFLALAQRALSASFGALIWVLVTLTGPIIWFEFKGTGPVEDIEGTPSSDDMVDTLQGLFIQFAILALFMATAIPCVCFVPPVCGYCSFKHRDSGKQPCVCAPSCVTGLRSPASCRFVVVVSRCS